MSSRLAAYRDVCEARDIVASFSGGNRVAKPAPRVKIDKVPGLSPMQLRKKIDQIVSLRTEMATITSQYEAVIKQMKGLAAEEKAGLDELKEVVKQMKEKDRYLVESSKGLLEFTAYMDTKRPGIEQMIGDPDASDLGDKAGAFFIKIGAALGKEIAKSVQEIYVSTKEDLSTTVDAVKALKVIPKTAAVSEATLRKAGVSDAVDQLKSWLAGKASKALGFTKKISDWVKGFVVRTKKVQSAKNDLLKSLNGAKAEISKVMR